MSDPDVRVDGGQVATDARGDGAGSLGSSVDILLVEDNPGDVRLTKEAFDDGSIDTDIHVVTDGVEAMAYLRQEGEYEGASFPDLMLLDLNLPKMSGQEVLAELNADENLRPLPVIVLTSSKAEEDVLRSYELQANAYLTKPVNPESFLETVQTFEEFWLQSVRLPPNERS